MMMNFRVQIIIKISIFLVGVTSQSSLFDVHVEERIDEIRGVDPELENLEFLDSKFEAGSGGGG